MKKVIVAISGASGTPLALRLLQTLQHDSTVEVHLVVSQWAKTTLQHEANCHYQDICQYASYVHEVRDLSAPIASGSFRTDGMIIVPCSMKTLASIRMGLNDNLITRAADVILKEKKKLVLVPRENPLSTIHLDNMHYLAQLGCVIMPPVISFYHQPKNLTELLDHLVMRILDQFDITTSDATRWQGLA